MQDVSVVQKMLEPLFPGLMGVRLTELAPDLVRAEMEVRPDLCTAGGILHGGAYMAFADTLGAVGTVIPAATTFLAHSAWRCNNATALAVGIDVVSVYIETDN